jgi:hypothetical protein
MSKYRGFWPSIVYLLASGTFVIKSLNGSILKAKCVQFGKYITEFITECRESL